MGLKFTATSKLAICD